MGTEVGSKEGVSPFSYSIVQEQQEVYPMGEDHNIVESTRERQISVFAKGEGNRQRQRGIHTTKPSHLGLFGRQ